MPEHSHSDEGGVGLLAFILGGVVVLVLAIALYLFVAGDDAPRIDGAAAPAVATGS